MRVKEKSIYEFDNFRLDTAQHILFCDRQIVPLTPKVFETLRVLVEKDGQVVEKDELLEKIWSDTIVEEASLAKNISVLRKVFKENNSEKTFIETIPKRGYRFTESVREVGSGTSPADEEEHESKTPIPAKKRLSLLAVTAILIPALVFAGYWWLQDRANQADAASDKKTVAVLPFKPLIENEEDQSLGLGMADALIIKLGQLDQVNVRPTSKIRQFTDQPQIDAMAAGKMLQVEAVLDGTIQRSGERLRVTAQLINVADGQQIWADTFEEKMTDFFDVQDAIAFRVANSLISRITESERQKLTRRYTNSPEAYRFYVLGQNWIDRETTEGFNKGIGYLHKAVEIDPNFANAYAILSSAYSDASESHMPPNEVMPKARFYAERALELDKNLPWAYYQIGYVKTYYEWDWEGAESNFKRASELDPKFARAYYGYGVYLSFIGKREEALANLEHAKILNPLNMIGSNILYRIGEYDRAIAEAEKALEMNPQRISSLQWVAMSLEQKGNLTEAIATFDRARQVEDTPELKAFQAHTYAISGNSEQALKTIDELKNLSKQQRYVSPFYIAVIYAGLGDKKQSLDWLEKAYEDRSFWIATLKNNPLFDEFRNDPHFQNLLRRVNL